MTVFKDDVRIARDLCDYFHDDKLAVVTQHQSQGAVALTNQGVADTSASCQGGPGT